MADPILESSLKTGLNTVYSDVFCCQIKKLTNFMCALKQLPVCFPSAAWHSSLLVPVALAL